MAVSRLGMQGGATPVVGMQLGRGEVVLDEIASADVAAVVANMTDMIVAEEAIARAETLSMQSELTSAAESQLAKPQVVATDVKTAQDITTHVVAEGETLDSIANRYNITTDTIKWANDLNTNTVAAGTKLTILPVSGVLHTVNDNDTAQSLAQTYRANAQQIIAFNDAEVSGLVSGQRIVIPEGIKPAPARNTLYASISSSIRSYRFFNVGSTFLGTYHQLGLRNGWCTGWAYSRSAQLGNPVGVHWGNAIAWPNSARRAGYTVNNTPAVGAVAQRNNHVVVVEAVSADKTMIKYSDQNGLAGWGRVAVTNDWVPASGFSNYIHR